MSGLFQGLEIGKRAMASHQAWLQTIGHNIANANTPGYSRQRVSLVSTYPMRQPAGIIGTGVIADSIYQVRDTFLSQQYRVENKSLGQWSALDKTMTQIESVFNEPSDNGLGGLMNKFWSAWSVLGNSSELDRSALVEQTNLLTDGLHRVYSELNELRRSVDTDLELVVDKVNLISDEIATLNRQISSSELGTDTANDLRDRRELLVDELSTYVDVNTREQSNSTLTVYISSLAIVEQTSSFHIGTNKNKSGAQATSEIVWANTDKVIKSYNGQLKGLVDTRDEIIPEYLEALDNIAQALVTNVNALHTTGYGLGGANGTGETGHNFFDPTKISAANITINQDIVNDLNLIAASQTGEIGAEGDGRNAQAIADLKRSLLMSDNSLTIGESYNALISKIGVATAKASNLKETFELMVQQVDNSRQSIQGVSLDEEMAQMIKYQNAFDAAARVIVAMDKALGTIIRMAADTTG
jgi:flagellar hook-associated protein 1